MPLGSTIYLARTRGGATWSSTQIARTGTGTALAGGIVVVRHNGEVLLAYPKVIPDKPAACLLDQECAGRVIVYALCSRDHGNTWSKPVVAARYRRAPVRLSEGDKIKASAEVFSLTLDPRGVAYLVAHDETHTPAVPHPGHPLQRRRSNSLGSCTTTSVTTTVAATVTLCTPGGSFTQATMDKPGKSNGSRARLTTAPLRSPPLGHAIGDYFGLQASGRDFLAAIVLARPLAQRGPTDIFHRRLTFTTAGSARRHHGRP